MKQYNKLDKKEKKILGKKENIIMRSKVSPLMDKMDEKIPDKLRLTLENAFAKGFQLVFEKGEAYIEKTYKRDKRILEHDLDNYAVEKDPRKKHIKKIDNKANKAKRVNTSFSLLEGGVLGFLGIGLPDIPFFIAVIMRTIYEVALSYGYDYKSDEEKSYILLLICGAMTTGDKQRQFNDKLDKLANEIDNQVVTRIDLNEQMNETAEVLADAMIVGKFIQGIPIVGAVGGVINYNILQKIGKFSAIKYKKRYLLKKLYK